jgi:tetratricopeptide (TPR) repeat protein
MFRFVILLAAALTAQAEQSTLEQANALFKAQHLSEAKSLAEQVLHTEPTNPYALEIKGNVQYLQGDAQAAIATFIDLLEAHPENQEAPYMLGRIYYQEGLLDQAIGQFDRLLKLNPASYKAYDNLGLCYAAKGDDEKATRYMLTAIKLTQNDHPEYDTAYADLAELLLKTGDASKAFGAASKAANRNPNSARNFYLGGKALDQLGKPDLALNWLQRSVALDPTYPEPQYLLARVYRKLGKTEEADTAQKKFLDLRARNPGPRR